MNNWSVSGCPQPRIGNNMISDSFTMKSESEPASELMSQLVHGANLPPRGSNGPKLGSLFDSTSPSQLPSEHRIKRHFMEKKPDLSADQKKLCQHCWSVFGPLFCLECNSFFCGPCIIKTHGKKAADQPICLPADAAASSGSRNTSQYSKHMIVSATQSRQLLGEQEVRHEFATIKCKLPTP